MNSYPPELLVQLAPVLFVAGLDLPRPPVAPDGPLDVQKRSQDPFAALVLRLREALTSQRKVAVWQPERAKNFQVVLVDKGVRFPPRKIYYQDDPTQTAHSPLSPLIPSSPLHPDGLIAPIWIRKHTTLVPSVFVLFLRLYESPPNPPRSPLDAPDADREKERDRDERRRDTELSMEISERKKSTNERNIKLTVVLIASRRMLDDPSLDARLTFIRRQSGLDSRAALFVLSPVSPSELNDFVRSLQQALFEPALEYYTSHSKRVRRKRNRHSQTSATSTTSIAAYPHGPTPLSGAASPVGVPARPLRPEGWTVRYEYKMASFAEFRGEDEVALKHYQDAYATLLIMFGSTAIMPPRTKRWAEAKVLADCISIKICKLYLYNAEHALALSQHNAHLRRFSDLSRGWGIGEETFEYWSWLARQYRIFAELLEQGTHSTLTIPTHLPVAVPPPVTAAQVQPQQHLDAMRALGINPSTALQHPGFYYFLAAGCTERRHMRFRDAETSQQGFLGSPGYVNEKKVDHLTIILELYTKSYELFKKYSPVTSQSQGRLTLWIAYRIAQTYHASGKFDMAVRFFERISKTYRRERWESILRPLLSTWYACARQLSDVELSVRLLFEMLGYGRTHSDGAEDGESVVDDLLAILESTFPSSTEEPFIVDLSESEPIFDSMVVFWESEVKIGQSVAFQIWISAPEGISLSALPFTSLRLHYADDLPPVVVNHAIVTPDTDAQAIRRVGIGHLYLAPVNTMEKHFNADLRWSRGSSLVLDGTLSSDTPQELKIFKAVLTLRKGSWNVEIPFDPTQSRTGIIPRPKWLNPVDPPRFIPIRRSNFASATVRCRPHQLHVGLTHLAPAYLDEPYPIILEVTNTDDRELEIVMDVLLQPGEDDCVNHIMFEGQRSSGLIKGVSFGGIGPGVTVRKTLQLVSTGAVGDRIIDISVQSHITSPVNSDSGQISSVNPTTTPDTGENLQTLVISAVQPFKTTQETTYSRHTKEISSLADLSTFDKEYWDDDVGGEALVRTIIECVGPWSLAIESVKFVPENGKHAKVIQTYIDSEEFPTEWLPGDEFSDLCQLSLAPDEGGLPEGVGTIPVPGHYDVSWRRIFPSGERGPLSITQLSLPALRPPNDGVIALLRISPKAYLHKAMLLELTIRNLHPTRSANPAISLELDTSDSFVVAGVRSGCLPILLPRTEHKMIWRLIPIECGVAVKLPRIRVTNKRTAYANTGPNIESQTEGEEVRIIDIRWDGKDAEGDEVPSSPRGSLDAFPSGLDRRVATQESRRTIVVLPHP